MKNFTTDKPILCVGDLIADLHVIFREESSYRKDTSVEGAISAPPPKLTGGGTSSNTASGIVKLGGRAHIAGIVGGDNVGRFLRADIESLGVDTTYLISDPARQSLIVLVVDDEGKKMDIWPKLGSANANYKISDLPKDFSKFDIIHISGSCFFLAPTGETLVEFMEQCKENDVKVSFDLNVRQFIAKDNHRILDLYKRAIDASDIILGSAHDEICLLTNTTDPNIGSKKLADMGKIVVCRDGGNPVKIFSDDLTVTVPTYPVEWLDVTGAGDIFNSGFIYGLAHGMSLEESAKLGCACSSYCVTKSGARSCPDLKTAMEIMDKSI